MDWDKVIQKVGDMARKLFTLSMSICLIIASAGGVYIVGLSMWWLVRRVQSALGT